MALKANRGRGAGERKAKAEVTRRRYCQAAKQASYSGNNRRHLIRSSPSFLRRGLYVATKFVITEDFYRPSHELISSRSLRDVRNVLRSLYSGLIQLKKRPPDDEPHIVEVWL